MSATFTRVAPIGDTDVLAIPVKEIDAAVAFYTQVLGFGVIEKQETSAILRRGGATIGLACNGKNPEQASCYFNVSDLDALHAELVGRQLNPGPIRPTEHNGKPLRTFFAKEPYGVCFCFGEYVEGNV